MGKGTLYGVGVGPGDPELVTLKAIRTIEACRVVVAPRARTSSSLALSIVRANVDLTCHEVIGVPFAMAGEDDARDARRADAAALVVSRLEQGLDVAMPTLGDPAIYSTFQRIAAAVRGEGFTVRQVPGVPSFCAVAAALDADLTPDPALPVHIVPALCRDSLGEVADLSGTVVLMKAGGEAEGLACALREAGVLERTRLVSNCGRPDELVLRRLDAPDVPDKLGYFSTAVVLP